jgi:DNA-binding NtrC family response regulator
VRLVSATHADLKEKVERGTFRRDLYFRVAVLTIELPPLRARREDLPELVEHFRRKHAARLGKKVAPAGPELLARLRAHEFPGNVRELENLIESLVVLSDGTLRASDLPPALLAGEPPPEAPAALPPAGAGPIKEVVRDAVAALERELIGRALREHANNVTHTAAALGLSRKGLQLKLKDLGIMRPTDPL